MASNNSPAHFSFKFDENWKKSYENCFPGLTIPSSQNPLQEVGLHKQLSKTFDELESKILINSDMSKNKENNIDKVIIDQNVTPKSQKQLPHDVKRWASVVKAPKRSEPIIEPDVKDKHLFENVDITAEIFDPIFKTFPKSFESHKGFFVINNKMFYCNICSLILDSVLTLSNHLKTRKHEDNAIEYFKTKMPVHLHYIMEFVSFYESNLWCNLCQCMIPMFSHNPHETIVNIMAHNNDESHLSKKVNHETRNSAETIMQVLSSYSPIIMEDLNLIETKMVPEFKCQLCKTTITYDENKGVMSQNFISHLKSVEHMNQKAIQVVKLFGDTCVSGKDNWAVVNGKIMCTHCNLGFETNLQQLVSHVSNVEHVTNRLLKLEIPSNCRKVIENNTVQENIMNEAKSFSLNKQKKGVADNKQSFESFNVTQPKPSSSLKKLLSTMPSHLQDIDYVIENEKGSITCLICNRVVPPSPYNLRTHLLGNKHKMNMEQKNEVTVKETTKNMAGISSQNRNADGFTSDQRYVLSVTTKQPQTITGGPNVWKYPGYILKTDKGSIICGICQYKLVNNVLAEEHLTSEEHKKRESLWRNNCPGCTSRNPFTLKMLKSLPTSIRTYKCRHIETIPASVLNHLYALLLKENQLVKNNELFLKKNVDGKHSYCTLCKVLIPLSLDVDVLEGNLLLHLKEKRHERLIVEKNTQDESTSPKVARSLFDLPDKFQQSRKDSKVYSFDGFTKLVSKDSGKKAEETQITPSTKKVLGNSDQELQGPDETEIRSPESGGNDFLIRKEQLKSLHSVKEELL